MRIISQDGTIDMPYERFIISVNMQNQGEIIAWTGNNISDDECIVMAIYSSREKAEKAMEMLREQYSRLQVVKILASGTCEHMEKSLSKDEFLECNLKYREMNIFQFPQDEDVEV